MAQIDKLRGKGLFEDSMEHISSVMDHKGMSSLDLLQAIDTDQSGDIDADEFRHPCLFTYLHVCCTHFDTHV